MEKLNKLRENFSGDIETPQIALKDEITAMIILLQDLIDVQIPAATISFVVDNAQQAFEA